MFRLWKMLLFCWCTFMVTSPAFDQNAGGSGVNTKLRHALGSGLEPLDAVAFAARCGAGALTGRGVAPRHVALEGG